MNIDILLGDQQRALRDTVRRFATRRVQPRAAEIDQSNQYPQDLFLEMAELGLLALLLPEKYGGGADTVCQALVQEELGRVSATVANTQVGAIEEGLFVHEHASDELREKYLPGIADGSIKAAFALTESDAGSDASGIKTRAVSDGDDWIINGEKVFVTAGSKADVIIVVAVTDPSAGSRGTTAFLVEKDTPGLLIGALDDTHGVRGLGTCSISLDGCRVPGGYMLGDLGAGLRLSLTTINLGRISTAAMAVGIAQGALDEALRYTATRHQFGQPLAKFQAVQFALAQMAMKIDAARLLYLHAAQLRDLGLPYVREASQAKLFSSEIAAEVTDQALMLHGAAGYVRESPVERFVRDARVTAIYEGTSNIQHLVIARELEKGR